MVSFRSGFPKIGFGVGLRRQHYQEVLDALPPVDWFEIISENFMVAGGRPRYVLERVRERYPVVMHGVSLSIGSTDPLKDDYLRELRDLARCVRPAWISDHLCWTGVGGRNLHDLLPLPYTWEALDHVVERIKRVQEFLGRPILIENVSSYLTFCDSVMAEWQFLAEVAERADCGILLDVNNVFVSAFNHGFDPRVYLDGLPAERVVQFHLAGHSEHGKYLLDTHDHPVRSEVWDLYAYAVRRIGPVATLIEWDDQLPPLERLCEEMEEARWVAQRSMKNEATCGNAASSLEADHRA